MSNQPDIPTYKQGFARYADASQVPGLRKGLVGLWVPRLGNTGLTLHDWSGCRNNGTLVNEVTWVPEGLNFDGANGVVDVPSTPELEITGQITFAARVMSSSISSFKRILFKGTGVSSYECYTYQSRFACDIRIDDTPISLRGGSVRNSNTWYNVAATFDGLNFIRYVDGVVDNLTANSGAITANGTALGFGSSPGATDFLVWLGEIAQVAIWNRALTASEITQHYQDPWAMIRQRPRTIVLAPAAPPVTGPSVGILHRGQMPGILARVA